MYGLKERIANSCYPDFRLLRATAAKRKVAWLRCWQKECKKLELTPFSVTAMQIFSPMKSYMLTLGVIFSLLNVQNCLSVDSQGSQTLQIFKVSYQGLAQNVAVANPWRDGPPSPAVQRSLDQLKEVAIDLLNQPNFAPTMLDLLNSYQNEDGYPRRQLFEAICYGHKYQTGDISFLKDVLLTSQKYKYDAYPNGAYKVWYTPLRVRRELGRLILSIASKIPPPGDPDWGLLESNPEAWVEKYAH